jgi:hypothetical protein
MKLDIHCPICGKIIPVTFRKPWTDSSSGVDEKKFNAKARFHHCNGISVKLELHPFDGRYGDEYLREGGEN